MALTIDWDSKVIESDASITDLPSFHLALRAAEWTELGMQYPTTHAWAKLDQGGGGFMYQVDLINGWELKFPSAGNYLITGNLNGMIVPVAGVYVERQRATAYITTSIGAEGVTPADVWTYGERSLTTAPSGLSPDESADLAQIKKNAGLIPLIL